MLELKEIKKDYAAGDTVVHALKGVSLQFRESEFVSILGPSGCGKTTMLNIIGGLDQYSQGDLVIDGRSTKDYKDRDWDSYRNNSIGFVFQSYNLIPHQTVLQNVELALTLSGVPKAERKTRAIRALEEVGLGNQLKKRPAEMSGGQMQRVAIARALVNNPRIILADEPTGALDTETSVQVMEILKKVAQDRLVVMVTHNPELAERYSTRIIRMLDGELQDDSMPLTEEELTANRKKDQERLAEAKKKKRKEKKPSMSFGTAFQLSLKNLFTKKGRTLLTTFAGSIGIIGIALIYAVSQGTTAYIDDVQEQTLSSYPLTLESTTIDLTTLMQTFMGIDTDEEVDHENDAVYSKEIMYDMVNALNSVEEKKNDLKSFKAFLEEKMEDQDDDLAQAVSGIQYTYDLDLLVYTENVDGEIIHSDMQELLMEAIQENLNMDMSYMTQSSTIGGVDYSSYSMMGSSTTNLWCEMLSGNDGELINPMIKNQYDLVYGDWPTEANEIVLVLDENNELDDMTLYSLGLEKKEDIDEIFQAVNSKEELEPDDSSWSYEDICNLDYRVILNSDCYTYDETTGLYTDMRDTETGLRYLYDNGIDLKVVGIIKPNEDTSSPMLSGSIAYTKLLTQEVIEKATESEAIKAQQEDADTDILTGLPFKPDEDDMTDSDKAEFFRQQADKWDETKKASVYASILSLPSDELVAQTVEQTMAGMTREDMEATMIQAIGSQLSLSESDLQSYVDAMSDEDMTAMFQQMISQQVTEQYAESVQAQIATMSDQEKAAAFDMGMENYTDEELAKYYDQVLEFSDSTYEDNLSTLGCVDLEDPASINLYASSFENKDVIEDAIAEYNEGKEELKQIQYTDYVGLIMSSVTSIINAITYVLIAFVAISLIVSSIMIGVITLISVQERTKEIGILRAIGASKRNVSSMFNAETIIIGFLSGLFGIGVTYLLCIPINAIIQHLTNINNLRAFLPVQTAAVLVVISMFLTLIAGIIPSRSAAKKDPVVALRSE